MKTDSSEIIFQKFLGTKSQLDLPFEVGEEELSTQNLDRLMKIKEKYLPIILELWRKKTCDDQQIQMGEYKDWDGIFYF